MAAPHYQIIRRPIITEKGLGVKELYHTVVFEVAAGATKTEIKEAVQQIFKVKVDDVRTANFIGTSYTAVIGGSSVAFADLTNSVISVTFSDASSSR